MKTLSLALLALLLPALRAAEPVHRSGNEFFAKGDFSGDGIPDLLVVDAVSGTYRILYRQAGGVVTASPTRDSGVRNVSSVSVGRIHNLNRDSLIVTGPDTNRVHLFQDTIPSAPSSPEALDPLEGIGPQQVVAVESMGDSPENEDSLFVYSGWNSSPSVHLRERFSGSSFLPIGVPLAVNALREGTPLRIKTTTEQVLAFLQTNALGDDFLYLIRFPAGGPSTLLLQPAPANGMSYAYGFFGGNTIGTFLFYTPGTTSFVRRGIETTTVPHTLLPAATHSFTHPITFLMSLDQGNGRILILDDNGKIRIYSYDGINAPVLLQQPALPVGASAFTSALALPGNELILFSTSTPGGASETAHQYLFSGGQYVLQNSHSLPTHTASLRANVIIYDGEPFVAAQPRRLFSGHVADWTVLAKKSGADIAVERDLDAGQPQGLLPATGTLLGTWPVGGTHSLVNQMDSDISVLTYETPLGTEAGDVVIESPSGIYPQALQIRMRPVPAGTPVWFRTAPTGIWQLYNGPFWIAQPTQLQAFAEAANGPRSPIRSASYSFAGTPANMDSDNDGVPDFVEINKGLDPTAGHDSDNDGISDLEELTLGLNPALADNPGALDRAEGASVFNLYAKPLPAHPISGVPGPAALGVNIDVRDLSGALLGSALSAVQAACAPCGAHPVSLLEALPADRSPGLLLLSTPAHFSRSGDAPDVSTGRELLRVLTLPTLPDDPVPYVSQGLSVAAEVAAWVQAATTHLANRSRPDLHAELRPVDTLAALLLERGIQNALVVRGWIDTEKVTLFPHRPNDANRYSPDVLLLRSLRLPGPAAEPALLLENHLAQIQSALDSGLPATQALVALVTDVYRVSAREHNAAPGVFDLPVDVLRAWLDTAQLPQAYFDAGTLTAPDVSLAHTQALALIAALPARPLETRSVQFQPGTGSCQLFMDSNGHTLTLLDAKGRAFPLPLSFALSSGMVFQATGYTDVTSPCASTAMEVLHITLQSVVSATGADSDGNLLPDAWERLLFGDIGSDFTDDSDDDGYSNLQEYLEGSDPRDGEAHPAVPVVDIQLPRIDILVGATPSIEWNWPAAYQQAFNFGLQKSNALTAAFLPVSAAVTTDGNTMTLLPPTEAPSSTTTFYRVGISLKE